MTSKLYTPRELRQFDQLTMMLSSRDQMDRIRARLHLSTFKKRHGEEKCAQMMAALKERDEKQRARKCV